MAGFLRRDRLRQRKCALRQIAVLLSSTFCVARGPSAVGDTKPAAVESGAGNGGGYAARTNRASAHSPRSEDGL